MSYVFDIIIIIIIIIICVLQIVGFLSGLHRVSCSGCKGANDIDFKFCKFCGMDRCAAGEQSVQQEESVVLMNKINERICAVDKILDASSYSQQKCSLKNELSAFLASLQPPKDLCTALPGDLRNFLVFKERKGRTQLHGEVCAFKGQSGRRASAQWIHRKSGAFDIPIQKNGVNHILFPEKRQPIIYLAALKKGAIRHAHPYYAIYRKLPHPPLPTPEVLTLIPTRDVSGLRNMT